MVAVFGVIGIVGFIVDMAVDNTWVSAVALSAMSGALVTSLSYRSQAQPRPGNPDTRIP